MRPALPCLVLLVAAARAQTQETRVATNADLWRAIAAARPGTRILLAPGDYQGGSATGLTGSQQRPIEIAAADPGHPPVFRGGLQFSDVVHLVIADLVIEGAPANGLNIDDGGSFATPSHDVVLRRVTVRDGGGRGNHDGIKLSGVDDFRVEDCTIERWGRGGSAIDMVGCHRGAIERCTLRDRPDGQAATGVQMKGGCRDVIVRHCVFDHAGERAVNLGGSTGLQYFRPRPEGFEAKDVTVERCTFVGSTAPIAFVGVDGAQVRWNTFHRPRKWFARILQETTGPEFVPCRHGEFTDNLVVWAAAEVGTPINVGAGTAPATFVFARNYWFCIDDPRRSIPRLPVAESAAAGGADPRFRDAANGDFRLAPGSPAAAHGAHGESSGGRR